MKLLLAVYILLLPLFVFASADLKLDSLHAQPDSDSRSLLLKLYMTNQGPADAGHLACNIYLYAEQKLVVSQTVSLNPLANLEKRVDEVQVDLPAAMVTKAKVEIFDSEEPDLQPSTNSAEVVLRTSDGANSDLQIVQAETKSTQPIADLSTVVHVRIRNNGPDAAPGVGMQISLLLFNAPVLTQEKRIGRIESGKDLDLDLPVNLNKPIPTTSGVFELKLMLDEDRVKDPVDYNNVFTLPVQLAIRMPDLIVEDVRVNEKGNLALFIRNTGKAPCDASETALYINGAVVQRFKTPALKPDGSQRFVYGATRPAEGTQVAVVADFNADIAESSEENNKRTFVVPAPVPQTQPKDKNKKKPDQ
jgi:hypothetical protein